jgi:hypothetical protein
MISFFSFGYKGLLGSPFAGRAGLAVLPAPLLAGIVGLLQPHSAFTYTLLAIAAGVALFLLFFQSWTLALYSVLSADEEQPPAPRRGTHDHGPEGDHPTMNASTTCSTKEGAA